MEIVGADDKSPDTVDTVDTVDIWHSRAACVSHEAGFEASDSLFSSRPRRSLPPPTAFRPPSAATVTAAGNCNQWYQCDLCPSARPAAERLKGDEVTQRLLYVFKLRTLGWSHRAIGVYMSCADGRHQVRRLTRQLGLKITDIKLAQFGYPEALQVALTVLAHHDDDCVDVGEGSPSLRDAAAAFLKLARSTAHVGALVGLMLTSGFAQQVVSLVQDVQTTQDDGTNDNDDGGDDDGDVVADVT